MLPYSISHAGSGRGKGRNCTVDSQGSPLQKMSTRIESQNQPFGAPAAESGAMASGSPREGRHRMKPLPSGPRLFIAESADDLLRTSKTEHEKAVASHGNRLCRSLQQSRAVLENALQSNWTLRNFGKNFFASDKKLANQIPMSSEDAKRVNNPTTTTDTTTNISHLICVLNTNKPLPDLPKRKSVMAKISGMKKKPKQSSVLERESKAQRLLNKIFKQARAGSLSTKQGTKRHDSHNHNIQPISPDARTSAPTSHSLKTLVTTDKFKNQVPLNHPPVLHSNLRPLVFGNPTVASNTYNPHQKCNLQQITIPSSPPKVTVFSSSPVPTSPKPNKEKTTESTPKRSNNNYSEINRLTNSAMSLLTLARTAPRDSNARKNYIELGKATVRMVNAAREMEQDREIAYQASIRTELRCIENRQLMEGMSRVVEGLLIGEMEGYADDDDDNGKKPGQISDCDIETRNGNEKPISGIVRLDHAEEKQKFKQTAQNQNIDRVEHAATIKHTDSNEHVRESEQVEELNTLDDTERVKGSTYDESTDPALDIFQPERRIGRI